MIYYYCLQVNCTDDTLLLWSRAAFKFNFEEVYKESPSLRIMINIQCCYQTMNIFTVNTVTLHLLSLHQV